MLALALFSTAAQAQVTAQATYDCKAFDGKQVTFHFEISSDSSGIDRRVARINGVAKAYPTQYILQEIDLPQVSPTSLDIGFGPSDTPFDTDSTFLRRLLLWDAENNQPYLCQIQGGGF
jgi:hypothetical protein